MLSSSNILLPLPTHAQTPSRTGASLRWQGFTGHLSCAGHVLPASYGEVNRGENYKLPLEQQHSQQRREQSPSPGSLLYQDSCKHSTVQ